MKAFNTAVDGAVVTFNRRQGPNWRVTLGGNRTLQLINLQKGDEITVMLVQDDTGSRSVTWPAAVQWATGTAPTLQASAGAVDLFTFRFDGTYLREVSGGGARLVNKVLATALAVVTVALGAVGGTQYMSYSGSVGAVQDAQQQYTQSGAVTELVYRRLGSGGILVSASGAGIGIVKNLRSTSKVTDGVFYATKNGSVTASGLTLSAVKKANNAYAVCIMSGGKLGTCGSAVSAAGVCTCQ